MKETFGERLFRLRTTAGLSQAKVARHLGITRVSVWNWEKNHTLPGLHRAPALAQLLNVSVEELALPVEGFDLVVRVRRLEDDVKTLRHDLIRLTRGMNNVKSLI